MSHRGSASGSHSEATAHPGTGSTAGRKGSQRENCRPDRPEGDTVRSASENGPAFSASQRDTEQVPRRWPSCLPERTADTFSGARARTQPGNEPQAPSGRGDQHAEAEPHDGTRSAKCRRSRLRPRTCTAGYGPVTAPPQGPGVHQQEARGGHGSPAATASAQVSRRSEWTRGTHRGPSGADVTCMRR